MKTFGLLIVGLEGLLVSQIKVEYFLLLSTLIGEFDEFVYGLALDEMEHNVFTELLFCLSSPSSTVTRMFSR